MASLSQKEFRELVRRSEDETLTEEEREEARVALRKLNTQFRGKGLAGAESR
jgi:hypothetical protein